MTDAKTRPASSYGEVMRLFFELGYIIAIPIVLFGFGGSLLDKYLGSMPLFMMVGFLLAIALSSFGVYRMIRRVNRLQREEEIRGHSSDSNSPQPPKPEEH